MSLGVGVTGYENQSIVYKIYENLRIFLTDLLPTNLTCILPNALSWVYRSWYAKSLQSRVITIQNGTANLFIHTKRLTSAAVLLLPGDHSHPLSMLHLADIAEAQGRTVLSVHLPYQDNNPQEHRLLLKKSIEMVETIISQNGGHLSHLLLAGHSRGALEAVNEAFVENNPKVNGVISIAGRFKVIKPSLRPCRRSLESSVISVWEHLRNGNLRVPFRQMAAQKDWCIDPEASIIRQDQDHLSINADHLSILNHPDTLRQFKSWVVV